MKEKNISQLIRKALGTISTVRLFTNPTSIGYVGKLVSRTEDRVVLEAATQTQFGLCVGSSDLIGWKQITITPEMVGKTVAVFTAIEVKTETGRLREEQCKFIDAVRRAGGLAGVARCTADAHRILEEQIGD